MKNIVILGSTGSIGRQAARVVLSRPDDFKVIGIAAKSDIGEMRSQIEALKPDYACLVDEAAARELEVEFADKVNVRKGVEGVRELSSLSEADIVLNAIVGSAGLEATIASLEADKFVALANKESLVAAGELVNKTKSRGKGGLIPVDSEHNALWQCLVGEETSGVETLILTASGGPFWGKSRELLEAVSPEEALAHPQWNMGPRISIDSATLMNKGFEVIEAHHLFEQPLDDIQVVIHPQSIIHSLIEFVDGSIKAQLGPTDMGLPILYCFAWPDRVKSNLARLDLTEIEPLEFFDPDEEASPCLGLAYEAARRGLSCPAVLNAADEVAVKSFLEGMIGFMKIGNIIDTVLAEHEPAEIVSIEDFKFVDEWARERTRELISGSHVGGRS